MHMTDALLSPAVGGTMWAVAAGAIGYGSRKVKQDADDRKAPLMGALGAFTFAAQMINFAIPLTGSSGHLGGGILLTILLGPHAALLTIASVLVVQALFFADGGLLALGCNIFNMGIIPAFVVYPLVYRRITGIHPGRARFTAATVLAAVAGLQLGPLCIVLETFFSGISELPFATFVMLMQPVHLAIGIVEGVVTVAVVSFVLRARPDILPVAEQRDRASVRGVVAAFLVAAVITGGVLSLWASKRPDGLEWAIAGITGKAELQGPQRGLSGTLAAVQEKTAFLPDYSVKEPGERKREDSRDVGTGISGIVGAGMTLILAFLGGGVLRRRGQPS